MSWVSTLSMPEEAVLEEAMLRDLLCRAVAGDEHACRELVGHLEPVIRRAVRVHLPEGDPFRRMYDSTDISQSVLIRFLAKAARQELRLESPELLRGLLRRMALQRLIDRRRWAAARGNGMGHPPGGTIAEPADPSSLSELIATRDLYQEVCRRLTRRELRAAELWATGHTFSEIADCLAQYEGRRVRPDAVRVMLQRAFRRVGRQFPSAWAGLPEPGL